MPDPKPARVRIVVCAVSKHRTAAQEPRARRPDPHPIRSAPEDSTRVPVRMSRVPSSQLSRLSNGVELITYVFHALPQSGPHYIGSYDIPFASTCFDLRSGPVSAAARPAATTHRAYRVSAGPFARRRASRGRAPAPPRPSPASGAGPRAPPEPRGVACSCGGAGVRTTLGGSGHRRRGPGPGAAARRGPRIAIRTSAGSAADPRARPRRPAPRHPIPRAEHQKWTRTLHSSGVLRYLFSMGMRL
jgi:hypothetical protein